MDACWLLLTRGACARVQLGSSDYSDLGSRGEPKDDFRPPPSEPFHRPDYKWCVVAGHMPSRRPCIARSLDFFLLQL